MSNTPKGIKGTRRKLRELKATTQSAIRLAMHEASKAIDQQTQELAAMRRILIAERAQVIYYTDKYCAAIAKTCVDVQPIPFLDLSEEKQTEYTKRAILELNGDTELAPHGSQGAKLILN